MIITNVKATAVAVPRSAVLKTSYGSWDAATTVIVELKTDEGITGIGQAAVDMPFYGESAAGMLANIRQYLAPAVTGESPLNIEQLNDRMKQVLPGHQASHTAIEIALWDIKGKAFVVPVYQLLGGKVRDGIELMGSVARSGPEETADRVAALLDATPFSIIKFKVGLDPVEDIEVYQAVAEAAGDRAMLHVDGNTGYTMSQAIPALTAMERIGKLAAIEQPVARLDDLAEIARRLPVPVMVDESIGTPADALEIVRLRAASLAFIKITKLGGILNVQKIAAIFEAAGIQLSIGIYYDVLAAAAAHIAAAVPSVQWPSPFTDLHDYLLTEPLVPEGQLLRVPEGPGLGVELDPEKVQKYALDL